MHACVAFCSTGSVAFASPKVGVGIATLIGHLAVTQRIFVVLRSDLSATPGRHVAAVSVKPADVA